MNMHSHQRTAIAVFVVMALGMPMSGQSLEHCSNNKATVQLEPNVIVALISWIAVRTKWVAQELPTICAATENQLIEMAYGGEGKSSDPKIHAFYEPEVHTVYLSEKWNPNNLRDRSYLLHELVHHLQALNNVKVACLATNERLAYELQVEWLREQGIQDPYKFLDIDEFTIVIFSYCPG